MYCPNCKNEYRKGIEICPECNLELVEELEEELDLVELFRTDDGILVEEVGRYFDHIGLDYDTAEDPETTEIIFSVDKSDIKTAKLEASTVIKVYSEKKAMGEYADEDGSDIPDEETEAEDLDPDTGKPYVSVKDKTSDYRSSGILFIIMGIVLVAVSLLNIMGILSFIPAKMSQILLIIIGVACVASGISSVLHSKKLQKEAGDEELLISQLKAALSEQYPPETFAEMMEDSDTTPELRYIQVQEEMKKALAGQFPAAASQLLDQLIEDYSDSMFS